MYGDAERTAVLTRTAIFVALIAIGGWTSVPLPIPIPFTLQTLFVLLAATQLRRYAGVPVAVYLLLGAMNIPLFHNGLAGIGVLLGPTGGYLAGFLPAVFVAGIAYEHTSPLIRFGGLVAASLIILGCGAAWLIWSTGMPPEVAVLIGVLPFLPGDLLKAGIAYAIAKRLP
jgi:biotin transport system substrate-specific component